MVICQHCHAEPGTNDCLTPNTEEEISLCDDCFADPEAPAAVERDIDAAFDDLARALGEAAKQDPEAFFGPAFYDY